VFSGRHSSSLLHSAGLPELVTASFAEYEALAVRLATAPELLAGLRSRLEAARASRRGPFDAAGFVRDLEQAYRHMHRVFLEGGRPRAFATSAAGGSDVRPPE